MLDQRFIEKQATYVNDPIKWAHDVIGFKPDKWQAEMMRDFIEHKFLAISTGTGVGKTCVLSVLIWFFLSTRPFPKVPCTAPAGHQLFDVLWAELAKWQRQSALLRESFRWTQKKITFNGHEEEWFAVARTSRAQPGRDTAEALQGFHADNILMVVDEASGVPDQIMSAVDGAITSPGAHVILTSNPTRRSGYFFKTITDKRRSLEEGGSFKIRHVSCEEALRDTSRPEMIDGIKIHIARALEIYGRGSDFYRVKVLGLPPLAEAAALITPEQVYEAHLREVPDTGQVFLSCDPARYGDDDTMFYVRKGWKMVDRARISGMDTMKVTKVGMDLVAKYKPDYYCIDVIGIGSGVYDRTRELYIENELPTSGLMPVHVGEKAEEEDKYYNVRAEIFWNLRAFIEKVGIGFDTEMLDEELTTITYGWDQKDSKIKIQSKDDIKKTLGRSPNDADAFAINFYPLIHQPIKVSAQYFGTGQATGKSDIVDKTKHQPHLGTQTQDIFFGKVDSSTDNLDKGGGSFPSSFGVVGAGRYRDIKRNQF